MMKSIVLSAVIVITLSSCYLFPTRSVYVSVPLPIPVEPQWVKIDAKNLECLANDTYERILTRDLQHVGYESRLNAILRSTHE